MMRGLHCGDALIHKTIQCDSLAAGKTMRFLSAVRSMPVKHKWLGLSRAPYVVYGLNWMHVPSFPHRLSIQWCLMPVNKVWFKTSLHWIPYAHGCDLSYTYSNVIVHDRSQPWAYGEAF